MITTHILDTSLGRPAENVRVTLSHVAGGASLTQLGEGVTDGDGRLRTLTTGDVEPGVYRLTFFVGDYFDARGTKSFYPVVEITFRVDDGAAHFHVPLLLNPYGYSTYRGS